MLLFDCVVVMVAAFWLRLLGYGVVSYFVLACLLVAGRIVTLC